MDVPGLGVGHVTLVEGNRQTGVTAVLPHRKNIFLEKVPAAAHIINGFGKSTGLLQIQELGSLETPIILTNTLCVGTAYQALVDDALEQNPEIGRSTGTVNPIVFECNDGVLNDIRGCAVEQEHVRQAIHTARGSRECFQGAVGAGRGMCCYDMKGGIGTSSRKVALETGDSSKVSDYTLAALVLSNFGSLQDLRIGGRAVGAELAVKPELKEAMDTSKREQGSVIVLLATDVPLSSRQLSRIARRGTAGLSRTGSFIASGSGEIVLAFTTANTVSHFSQQYIQEVRCLHEDFLDSFFLATTEAIEEAVLNSLIAAVTVVGRDEHVRYALADYLPGMGFKYSGPCDSP